MRKWVQMIVKIRFWSWQKSCHQLKCKLVTNMSSSKLLKLQWKSSLINKSKHLKQLTMMNLKQDAMNTPRKCLRMQQDTKNSKLNRKKKQENSKKLKQRFLKQMLNKLIQSKRTIMTTLKSRRTRFRLFKMKLGKCKKTIKRQWDKFKWTLMKKLMRLLRKMIKI